MDAVLKQNQRIFYLPRPSRLIQVLKARILPPEIKEETIQQVLKHYGLDLINPPGNLPFGRRSRIVLIDTSEGKKVLKLYKGWWRSETIHYEHSILQRLEELDFSAPRLHPTLDRDTLVSLGEKRFSLFDFIQGNSLNWSYIPPSHRRRLYTIAGITLAEFHQRMQGFLPAGKHHLGFRSYSGERWRNKDWHIQALRRLEERPRVGFDPRDENLLGWFDERSSFIQEQLMRLYEILDPLILPRTVIHGDYGVHNLEFDQNGSITVHDFELARLEWRLIDLVAVCSRIDKERIQHFITAYQSKNPISPEEWHFFPQVWQFYMLQGAIQSWDTYFEVGGTQRLVKAQKRVNLAQWALENQTQLFGLLDTAAGGD